MWEHVHRFSTRGRGLVERYVPWTSRVETVHAERLRADREGWVLKSDYGAEGEEVVIGRETDDATWAQTLAHVRPGRWVAQRFFEALPERRPGGAGQALNYGVFLVGGQACGLFVRRQSGATDEHAVSVPVLVRGGQASGAVRDRPAGSYRPRATPSRRVSTKPGRKVPSTRTE